jgi:hypothetical protein
MFALARKDGARSFKNPSGPETASIGRRSHLVEGAQRLPYLVILKGILNATFVGYECFFTGDLRSHGTAQGVRPASRVIIGDGSFLVCHSSSPSHLLRVIADHALTAWPQEKYAL